jgi:hypothetical protein
MRTLYGLMWLALLAVLVRALIPLGYMPSMAQKDGTFQMVVCSLDGPKTVTVQTDFDPQSIPEHTEQAQEHCVFALLGHTPCIEGHAHYFAINAFWAQDAAIFYDYAFGHHSHTLSGQVQARAPPIFS